MASPHGGPVTDNAGGIDGDRDYAINWKIGQLTEVG
jgi:hypothetical protein